MTNAYNDVITEKVSDALKANKDEIGKAIFDYMAMELCPTCLENKEWLNSKEAAFYLGIEVATLHNYCYQRKIKYQKIGKRSEFNIEWLKDFRAKNAKVYEPVF